MILTFVDTLRAVGVPTWLGLVALGLAASLAGCATSPVSDLADAMFGTSAEGKKAAAELQPTAQPSRDALLDFLASATPNSVGSVRDAATGEMLKVLAMPSYQAASGHICRSYRIEGTATAHGREGLACQDGNGTWYRNPVVANPSN